MLINDPSVNTSYDEIYVGSWQAAVQECSKTLWRDDHKRALQVRTKEDFRNELQKLVDEYIDADSKMAIAMIHPVLDHYEQFAKIFVNMLAKRVETSMMWGLLFLVFKLALGDPSTALPLHVSQGPLTQNKAQVARLRRITKWLERIGLKLRTSNDCTMSIKDFSRVKSDVTTINREIVVLWLNIIMTYRNNDVQETRTHAMRNADISNAAPRSRGNPDDPWNALTEVYNNAYENIEEAVKHTGWSTIKIWEYLILSDHQIKL